MNSIGIIGTGRLGTRLSEQLILDKIFSKIYLWNRSNSRLEGTIQSLKIWSKLIGSNTEISKLDFTNFNDITLIVIVIKENYDPRLLLVEHSHPKWLPNNLRFVGLLKDLPQIKNICSKLYNYSGKVVIITNPVDVITSLVTKWLPNSQVLGLGLSVDSARLNYLLSNNYNRNFLSFDLILGGEHGGKIVPIRSLWEKHEFLDKLDEKTLDYFLKKANNFSINIVKNLGYTLQDCAYVFSNDLSWLIGKSDRKISMHSIWNKEASIGYPVILSESSQKIEKFKEIAQVEKSKIEKLENLVSQTVNLIIEKFDY